MALAKIRLIIERVNMDPDAAWATILNPRSTHRARADAALALLAWLASEGFLPASDVGRAGVVEVCKAAVEIALEEALPSHKERHPAAFKPHAVIYLRLLDLEDRAIYRIDSAGASIGVWNGSAFVTAQYNRLIHVVGGDGITKGQARATQWIGTLPDRIMTRVANNKPLFNYLTSLERDHGTQPGGMDVHSR